MDVYPKMDHAKIAGLLSKHHIGLLPMPESKVWKIASPLKRSEYIASGLLVFGIDHPGHRMNTGVNPWMKLVKQEDFHTEGCDWMGNLNEEKMASLVLFSAQTAANPEAPNCIPLLLA